ncbi:MAG: glycosyltransferase family 4 protein, partial [Planctomycetia bacterium]|nr:glycosyltransferase family 4 protein [Planctomycetia bacterium]
MHIATFLEAVSEFSGGAHTFEADVLEGVRHVAVQGKHRFTLCVPFGRGAVVRKWVPDVVGVAELPEVRRPAPERRSLKNRVFARLGLSRPVAASSNGRTVGDVFRECKIDFAWMTYPHAPVVDIPYLATIWDLQHRLQPVFPEVTTSGWTWEQREQHYSRYIPRSTAIITGTEEGKSEIALFYRVPSERIAVIPLPTPKFPAEVPATREQCIEHLKERYQLPPSYLLYPAQFWPHKNHVGAILTLAELRNRHAVDCPLVCVGADQGNLDFVKEEAARRGVADLLHFCGYIPRVDLGCLYRAAEALLFPSFFGPDNLPPLEAFSLGCPVIAANVPGAAEQLGDAALLVNPTDPQEMAAAVLKLRHDPEMKKTLIA